MKIRQNECFDGAYHIGIDNIGLSPETMLKCSVITESFAVGEEFYFGFFRTDGFNLTGEEFLKYDEEIPRYLLENGRYELITHSISKKNKEKLISGYHAVASLPVNDMTYSMLPILFNYHLETTFFCPNIEWEEFVQSFRDYMKHGAAGYVMNGFTDFLFTYVDSGDFSVYFNPKLHDITHVYQKIAEIMSLSI